MLNMGSLAVRLMRIGAAALCIFSVAVIFGHGIQKLQFMGFLPAWLPVVPRSNVDVAFFLFVVCCVLAGFGVYKIGAR